MDHAAFDSFTQQVARRRIALWGGAALLSGLTQFAEDAEAKCKRPEAKCDRKSKCCAGSRCKRRRCRCKTDHEIWAGVCCKDRFAWQDEGLGPGDPYFPDTEFCCPAGDVCSRDGNPVNDDCCQENETCLNGECCCDGCRGTVICGGVCCGSSSCCNGVCCGTGQVCAETSPGVLSCVADQVSCTSSADCRQGETCWDDVCCSADRMCSFMGQEICCGEDRFCDPVQNICCPNHDGCSTGKKVRIRV